MTRPLRIHADPAYLPPGEPHVTMLYPFWGRAPVSVPRPDFADRYLEHGREFLELTELADADVAVFPQDYKRGLSYTPDTLGERVDDFVRRARAAGKPYLFFRDGDATDPVPVADAIVARPSLLRSRRPPREHAMPAFHEDLLEHTGGTLPVREWSRRSVVGFCGTPSAPQPVRGAVQRVRWAASRAKRPLLERLGRPLPEDVWVRGRAIEALQRQDLVATNIVLRDAWGGGAFFPFAPERWRQVRREFVDNIVESDYVLCARGGGNFSYRLYETLCLGRIPVVVDTDLVLPYDAAIDWRRYAVWLDRTEIPRIGEHVAAFHESLGPEEFVELQHACRRLWEEYLRPEGYFAHFHLLVAEATARPGARTAASR